ncbi:polysaccharide export outer membrane protein [Flavobacterium fontis]|uniref:Polysaccharide export outer membrane protein n=1 Tax=Flavobacterium fontis TaxID=1124188 RepID=A0A1M5CPL7_9FLAO|nr:polysaccharide biosynthesis/export family protein [Flavobacterium fontis]SHF56342.1 polysaccharide export outer membrane protein [Flavobacterium fontis]
MKKISLLFLLLLALTQVSCVSKKKYYYLQGDYNMGNAAANYEPIIQKDDRISIVVMTYQRELSEPFNLSMGGNGNVGGGNIMNNPNAGYLVDSEGTIDFPTLGKLSVAGYTIEQLRLMLTDKLKAYLVDPIINIRILNFKVTVLGAVLNPGVKSFNTNRVTILDVLAESGDVSPFGRRQEVLIIRDYQGVKSFNTIDLTKADLVNSPFFYMDQNDVVYVRERKAKIDATALPNLPIIVSSISFLTTMILLLTR